jgi:hypothetical protein
MEPPDDEASFRPVAYQIGGGVANLVVLAAAAAALLVLDLPDLVAEPVVIFAGANLGAGLLNLWPTRGSLINDGTHLAYCLRSPGGRSALYRMLKANALMAAGARPRDLPEDLYVFTEAPIPGDPLVGTLLAMRADRLNDLGFWDQAAEVMGKVVELHLPAALDGYARAELLYYRLTCHTSGEAPVGDDSAASLKQYLRMGLPGALRVRSAMSAYTDHDEAKALELLDQAEKRLGALGNDGGAKAERAEIDRLRELLTAGRVSQEDVE